MKRRRKNWHNVKKKRVDMKKASKKFDPKAPPPPPGKVPFKPYQPVEPHGELAREHEEIFFKAATSSTDGVRFNLGEIISLHLPKGTLPEHVDLEICSQGDPSSWRRQRATVRIGKFDDVANESYIKQLKAYEKAKEKYKEDVAQWRKDLTAYKKREATWKEWNEKKRLWDATQQEKTKLGKLKKLAEELGIAA